MIEHQLFRGNSTKNRINWAQTMDVLGGEFNVYTDREEICLSLTTTKFLHSRAQDFLIELITQETLNCESLNSEKKIILNEIYQTHDDFEEWLWDKAIELTIRDHLGLPVLGKIQTIKYLTPVLLEHFFQRFLKVPKLLCISGDFKSNMLQKNWNKISGNENSRIAKPQIQFETKKQLTRRWQKESQQAYVMGIIPIHDPIDLEQYLGLQILMFLWGGANSSRLFQKIREERGLCYTIQSGFVSLADKGFCYVLANTLPKNLNKLLNEIETEWKNLWLTLTKTEWEFYKQCYETQIQVQLEKLDYRNEVISYLFRKQHLTPNLNDYIAELKNLSLEVFSNKYQSFRGSSILWYIVTPSVS